MVIFIVMVILQFVVICYSSCFIICLVFNIFYILLGSDMLWYIFCRCLVPESRITEMHAMVGFNVVAILTACVPLLLSALKTQAADHGSVNKFQLNEHRGIGRWKRGIAFPASCQDVQKLVDDRVHNMSSVSLKLFVDDVEFNNDNKTSLQMSWTGHDTERVIVITSDGVTSTVYLSDETSKKFDNISARLGSATGDSQLSLQKHPLVAQIIYIVAYPLLHISSSLFISTDAGNSFTKVPLPFLLSARLVFHPNDSALILANDKLTHKLFLSKDKGFTWSEIKSGVISFKWSTVPHSSDIFVVTGNDYIIADSRSNVLQKSTDFGNTWTQLYKNVYSFGSGGKFLYTSFFVSSDSTDRKLVVSTDAGMHWNHVLLPSITPDRFFSILDASEGQIFLHVDEPGDTGKGILYLSDATGVVFTKSLENHLYPNFEHETDFYAVRSMRGVYIANQLVSDNSIRTVISYNRGGDWQPIERPKDVPCTDETQKCFLQIHNTYSMSRGVRANPPMSVPNAVGIILAHGHVAASLQTSHPDVFVSSDGGYNWRLALTGPHHYVIGDHGGLLVAIPADTNWPSVVKFSTDEGRCWLSYNFTKGREPIQFTGLLIEPGNKAMMVAIWGYTKDRVWHTIFVNFTALIDRRCGDNDYEDWVAHSHQAGGCMLGSNETFRRLKPDSWCYNGKAYSVSKTAKPCLCTVDDYDCDFGYMRQENVDKCVEDPSLKDSPIHICLRNHEENMVSVGYHKIPGDMCQGGYIPDGPRVSLSRVCMDNISPSDLSADTKQEHGAKPSAGVVVVILIVIIVVIAAAVVVTMYAKKRRMFSPSYHYMSIRSGDTKPLNTSVYDESSDDEPVLAKS